MAHREKSRFRLVSHFPLGLFATCRLLFSVKGRRRHKFYLKIRVTCLVFLGDKPRSKNCTTKDARCTTQQRLSQVAHQRKTSTGCSLSQVYILVYLVLVSLGTVAFVKKKKLLQLGTRACGRIRAQSLGWVHRTVCKA